jgi:hypothetical protein
VPNLLSTESKSKVTPIEHGGHTEDERKEKMYFSLAEGQ